MLNVLYLTLKSPTCLVSFSRRSAGMIPCLGRCKNGLETWVWEYWGCMVGQGSVKRKSAKPVGSNPTVNAIPFFLLLLLFYFSIFSFFFFCLNNLFLLSVCMKHYSPITILHVLLSNLSQVYVELNTQVLYEFKLTQFHVYKACNLSLLSLDFTFCLSIIDT